MPDVLSEKGEELLELLPPYERQDPTIQAAIDSVAREFQRIDDEIANQIANATPHLGEDYLHFWEALLDLPVSPPGKSLSQRRDLVITFLRRVKKSASGVVWLEKLIELIGGNFVHVEDNKWGIRQTHRDRFDDTTLGGDWAFLTGANTLIVEGGEFRETNTGTRLMSQPVQLDQSFSLVRFRAGASGPSLGVAYKILDADNHIRAEVTPTLLRLVKRDLGVETPFDTDALTLTAGEEYWIFTYTGNAGEGVAAEVWDCSPLQAPVGKTYLARVSVHLAGGDLTKFGTPVVGDSGIYWTGLTDDWRVGDWRVGEAEWALGDYVLRIVLPFDQSTAIAYTVEQLAREITPAHLDLEVFFDSGFVLGVSQLGVQAL